MSDAKEPAAWAYASECDYCHVAFGWGWPRRHHCRKCGKSFCFEHSQNWTVVPECGPTAVRVCQRCFPNVLASPSSPPIADSPPLNTTTTPPTVATPLLAISTSAPVANAVAPAAPVAIGASTAVPSNKDVAPAAKETLEKLLPASAVPDAISSEKAADMVKLPEKLLAIPTVTDMKFASTIAGLKLIPTDEKKSVPPVAPAMERSAVVIPPKLTPTELAADGLSMGQPSAGAVAALAMWNVASPAKSNAAAMASAPAPPLLLPKSMPKPIAPATTAAPAPAPAVVGLLKPIVPVKPVLKYIVDVDVRYVAPVPNFFNWVAMDPNPLVGHGPMVYYRCSDNVKDAICDIRILVDTLDAAAIRAPNGYTFIRNAVTRGHYICFSRNPKAGNPIMGIRTVVVKEQPLVVPIDYQRVTGDLGGNINSTAKIPIYFAVTHTPVVATTPDD